GSESVTLTTGEPLTFPESGFAFLKGVAMNTRTSGISRRGFFQGAAAAALGGPLLVSGAALGQEKKAPANDRLGLGFIGVGTQNRGHLNHFLGQKEGQVLAVCGVDTKRRENPKK